MAHVRVGSFHSLFRSSGQQDRLHRIVGDASRLEKLDLRVHAVARADAVEPGAGVERLAPQPALLSLGGAVAGVPIWVHHRGVAIRGGQAGNEDDRSQDQRRERQPGRSQLEGTAQPALLLLCCSRPARLPRVRGLGPVQADDPTRISRSTVTFID